MNNLVHLSINKIHTQDYIKPNMLAYLYTYIIKLHYVILYIHNYI